MTLRDYSLYSFEPGWADVRNLGAGKLFRKEHTTRFNSIHNLIER